MSLDEVDDANIQRERTNNKRRNVAVVALRDGQSRLLMTRSRRLPDHWQPVGGGMEPEDVSPRAAAVREVEEETGVDIQSARVRAVFEAPYDFGEGTVYFFETTLSPEEETAIRFNKDEILEHRWVTLQDAVAMRTFPATFRFLEFLVDKESRIGDRK